jgi:hypothetical protein
MSTSACNSATSEFLGWRKRLNNAWAAVAFGRSAVQAADELAAYLRRERGYGRAAVLAPPRRSGRGRRGRLRRPGEVTPVFR